MGKKVAIEDRAVHKVQAYLTKKEYSDLEKFCLKKKGQSVLSLRKLLSLR